MNSSAVEKPSKIESWLLASRPRTLLAAVVPVMVGSSLAISQNKFTFILSLIALFCSILIQVGTNFTNDLYDYLKGTDKEDRVGPRRVLVSGLITTSEMKLGIITVFGLAFLLGLYLVYAAGIVILIIGVISILAGLAYTAGPYPLAYNGLGDVFVFAFFGIVGTTGTYYLHLHEFSLLSFLIAVPVGALITNILVVNNYRDIKKFTRFQFVNSIAISYLILFIIYFKYDFTYWIFLPLISLPIAVILIKRLQTFEGERLNNTLELSAKYAALFGLLFSLGLIL